MPSKPRKRTGELLICKKIWKLCSTAKTRVCGKMPPPFPQPSCVLPFRCERTHHRCPIFWSFLSPNTELVTRPDQLITLEIQLEQLLTLDGCTGFIGELRDNFPAF